MNHARAESERLYAVVESEVNKVKVVSEIWPTTTRSQQRVGNALRLRRREQW